jgi:hypothetical protein
LQIAARAGIAIPASLPLLDTHLSVRPTQEAVDRLLTMTAIAAASYGFDRDKGLAWLKQERLDGMMTPAEQTFLVQGKGPVGEFQVQIEAMWALAWALGIVAKLDFWKGCDKSFAAMLPNLKISASSARLRSTAKMRPIDEITESCDLAYCLHWAVRQARLESRDPPGQLKAYVIEERRRALEWLLSNERWDSVSLDT